jgi:hypothetical protein
VAAGGDGITLGTVVTFIVVFLIAAGHPEKQVVIRAIGVYRDDWVSAFGVRLRKRHFRGFQVKKSSIDNPHYFYTDDHSRRWGLHLLDLTID